MDTMNQIGLNEAQGVELANRLNVLLANYQLFYINARGFHWNIKGEKFFELHAKFEELYNDSLEKIDEIAERILTLGHVPTHSFTAYTEQSEIKEAINVSGGKDAIQHIVSGIQTLLRIEREILNLAGEANDEGTGALMGDYIRQQEKALWMYSAYLK